MQPWPIILEFVLKKQNRFHMENEYFKFITKITISLNLCWIDLPYY